ncbi:MAG: transcriptional regulator, partial [Porphyrobacter sp.]|nr:transcriptional regulator [Porphyrobacter sp.]
MDSATYAFAEFSLDQGDRRLRRDGEPVELSSRYFDALALLLAERGKLVSKDRFMDEVWRGVPVTDEALTQCIKTLRRQLGDDAASPRFIETVPKHGYRFIAPVRSENVVEPSAQLRFRQAQDERVGREPGDSRRWHMFWLTGAAGAMGGGAAGVLGGLLYGFAAAAPAMGA